MDKKLNYQINIERWQDLVDLIAELTGSTTGAIVCYTNNRFKVSAASSNSGNFLHKNVEWEYRGQSFCRQVVDSKQLVYINDALQDDFWKHSPAVAQGPVRSYCGVPVYAPDGSIFGTVCAIDTKATEYQPTLPKLLNQLSRLVSADLMMAYEVEKHKRLAITDPFTSLLNRRGFNALAEQQRKEAQLQSVDIGILYLDINNLKLVNDQHGHEHGDRCINLLAQALKQQAPETSLTARLGGDEFTVFSLLYSHDKPQLHQLAQDIQSNYEKSIAQDPRLAVSGVSIGIHQESYQSFRSLDELLCDADKKMYLHKQASRQ